MGNLFQVMFLFQVYLCHICIENNVYNVTEKNLTVLVSVGYRFVGCYYNNIIHVVISAFVQATFLIIFHFEAH